MLGRIVVVAGLMFAPRPALAVEPAPTEGQDYATAKLWYERAALGDTSAMQTIAALHGQGMGQAGTKR